MFAYGSGTWLRHTVCRGVLIRAGLEQPHSGAATGKWSNDGSGPHFSVFSNSVARLWGRVLP